MSSERRLRLWHLPTSHYSEKVRWALDVKRVPHTRRVPLIVPHVAVAHALTRGDVKTFPVVQLDGRAIGDSTAIIATLEREFPQPPLYPADPAQRARALELEDWFDRELGPHIRVLALGEVTRDPDVLGQLSAVHTPAHMKPFPDAWAATFRRFVTMRYGLDRPEAADAARAGVARAFDHLESQLGDAEYLVGDTFTVADLSAASHFYWLLQPAEGPHIVDHLPAPLSEFVRRFEGRRGPRWVEEMYRRHRRGDVAARPAPAAAATA